MGQSWPIPAAVKHNQWMESTGGWESPLRGRGAPQSDEIKSQPPSPKPTWELCAPYTVMAHHLVASVRAVRVPHTEGGGKSQVKQLCRVEAASEASLFIVQILWSAGRVSIKGARGIDIAPFALDGRLKHVAQNLPLILIWAKITM